LKKTVFIAVANHKGGCGKTTTVVNLAAEFGRMGLSVVVVDLDPQANASMHISTVHPSEVPVGVAELLSNDEASLTAAIIEKTNLEGVALIFGSLKLNQTEDDIRVNAPRPAEVLKYRLQPLDGIYDVVIFDTPPSLKLLTSNALAAATHVIIPVESGSQYGMYGVSDLLHHLGKIRQVNPEMKSLGALLMRHDERQTVCKILEAQASKLIGELLETRISSSTKVPQSSMGQKSVHAIDRSSKVAREFRQLAEEVATKVGLKFKRRGKEAA
jgi:chromosome partitioning protein